MPTWALIAVAVAILVVGMSIAAFGITRSTRSSGLQSSVPAARARLDSLRYRLDAVPAGVDVSEATRLLDSADATLSSARSNRSRGAIAECLRTLDAASAELDRVSAP